MNLTNAKPSDYDLGDWEEIDRDLRAIEALGAWDRAVAAWKEAGGRFGLDYWHAAEEWLCLAGLPCRTPASVAAGL